MKLLAAIAFVLLLSGAAYAAECSKDDDCTGANAGKICACGKCEDKTGWYTKQYKCVSNSWESWGSIAMIGVMIMFLIVAFSYMIAVGFDLPELKMWAKAEFYQALASALLVAWFASLTFTMFDSGVAVILGQSINPFNIADNYLTDMQAKLQDRFREAYYVNYPVEGATTISIFMNGTAFELYFLTFLKPIIIEPLHLVAFYCIQFLITISMWKGIMVFFRDYAFSMFFPLGIFLRIFPITRGAGGLLIAMAVGFFIVFPIMFGFIAMMSGDQDPLGSLGATQLNVGLDLAEFNACENDIEGMAQDAEQAADPVMLAAISSYFSFLPELYLKIFFYPIVVMAATITFIKIVSPLLGSDVSEIGQGLIKLI